MKIEYAVAILFLLIPLLAGIVGIAGCFFPSKLRSGFKLKINSNKVKISAEPEPSIISRLFFLVIGVIGFVFFFGVLDALITMMSYK